MEVKSPEVEVSEAICDLLRGISHSDNHAKGAVALDRYRQELAKLDAIKKRYRRNLRRVAA